MRDAGDGLKSVMQPRRRVKRQAQGQNKTALQEEDMRSDTSTHPGVLVRYPFHFRYAGPVHEYHDLICPVVGTTVGHVAMVPWLCCRGRDQTGSPPQGKGIIQKDYKLVK